jgi:ABC-type branched-subunit amino acid transport system substrate-binding protein
VRPTGTPILVGQIIPMTGANIALPAVGNAVTAAVDSLNAAGGINGHPVKLDQCDTQGTPSGEIQCAQQMVSDHVVATVADSIFSSSSEVNTILHGAGIARIGVSMFDTTDYQNPDNFALDPGGVFSIIAGLDDLIKKGDKTFSILLPDASTSSQIHLLLDPIAASLGVKIVNYVLVSSASGDFSQYVAQAEQNGAQGAFLALGNAQLVQVLQTINQLNPKMDWASGIAGMSLDQLKQLQPVSKKVAWPWWTPGIDDTANFPGLKQVQESLSTYVKGFTVQSSISQVVQPWLAVRAFSEIVGAQKTGAITASSVLADTLAAKDLDMLGIIKPWTPSAYISPGTLGAIFKNISNPWSYPITYTGSATKTSASELFNVFVGLPGYAGTGSTTTTTSG